MCLTCVCSLLCKLISLAISILFIVAIVLIVLWATGVIFQSEDGPSQVSNSVRHALRIGGN